MYSTHLGAGLTELGRADRGLGDLGVRSLKARTPASAALARPHKGPAKDLVRGHAAQRSRLAPRPRLHRAGRDRHGRLEAKRTRRQLLPLGCITQACDHALLVGGHGLFVAETLHELPVQVLVCRCMARNTLGQATRSDHPR